MNFRDYVVSSSYPELAKKIELTKEDERKIWLLETTIWQPTFKHFVQLSGTPAKLIRTITSGKRSVKLNSLVGGSETSDHLFKDECAASDGIIEGLENQFDVHLFILDDLPHAFGQLIYYHSRGIVHVSLPSFKHQGEYFEK